MAISNASRAMFFRGELKIGIWSGDTAPTIFYGPINFSKITLVPPKQDMMNVLSTMITSPGSVLASVAVPKGPATMTGETDYMPPDIAALFLGATVAAQTLRNLATGQTSSLTTSQLSLYKWAKLDHEFINSITSAIAGATTLVGGTDYATDTYAGLYQPLTSAATAATTVTYSTSALTTTGEVYAGGLAQTKYIQLYGKVIEQVSNKRGLLTVHKVSIAPSSKFDLRGDFLVGNFDGELITPSGEDSPWQLIYSDVAI